jgi:hypothetical protein
MQAYGPSHIQAGHVRHTFAGDVTMVLHQTERLTTPFPKIVLPRIMRAGEITMIRSGDATATHVSGTRQQPRKQAAKDYENRSDRCQRFCD